MGDVTAAAEALRQAEDKCKSIPLTLPPWIYRRRLNAAMAEWRQANLALFDAQVAEIDREAHDG